MSGATPVVARPRKVWRVAVPAAIVLFVVFTIVGISLGETPTGAHFRLSDQIAMIVLGLLLATGALLPTRPRLRADHDGLEVRNVLSSYRYSWDEVLGISFPESAPWARVELPDDEYVPVMAIQAWDGTRAVTAMRELRELRRALGHHV